MKIALSPREQAALYVDLELLICACIGKFLLGEWKAGRVRYFSQATQVIGDIHKSSSHEIDFQYVQGTFKDIVLTSIDTLYFEFRSVSSMLHGWKGFG